MKFKVLLDLIIMKNKQILIFSCLMVATIFDVILLRYRMEFIPHVMLFLVWNLFLAWIPYIISLAINIIDKKWLTVGLLPLWLIFFPNAPYIITDFIHLRARPEVPLILDVLLISSFAATGMALALVSLSEIHQFLIKQISKKWIAHLLITMVIPLAGIGVWIGRVQRWNSWDVIYQPKVLFADLANICQTYNQHMEGIMMAFIFSVLLGISYLFLISLQYRSRVK